MVFRYALAGLLLAYCICLPTRAAVAPQADLVTRADEVLSAHGAEKPGLAVIVARDDAILYERYSGLADMEHQQQVTPESRFHLGSVSKQFYAFAALKLAQQGRLDLDADIHTYLPELRDYGVRVTTRQLINHTAGIRDIWELMILSGRSLEDAITHRAAVAMLARQEKLNFPPGTDFRYSNGGYILIAEIIARTSGMTTRKWLEKSIFLPLGMRNTSVFDDGGELVPQRVQSYQPGSDDTYRFARMNFTTLGPAGVISTPRDLLIWARALTHESPLDAALVSMATTPGNLVDGTPLTYAAGLVADMLDGRRALMHSGAEASYRSAIAAFPHENAQIIALSSGSVETMPVIPLLADIFLGKKAQKIDQHSPVLPDSKQLAALAGYYVNDWDTGIDLVVQDGTLAIVRGTVSIPVTFVDARRFYVGVPANRFEIAADGTLSGRSGLSGTRVDYRRAKRAQPKPSEIAAIGGIYFSEELDITYHVIGAGDHLTLQNHRFEPVKLYPGDTDAFETVDFRYPNIRITLVRDAARAVTGFQIATGRMRGLVLQRK